MLHRSLSHRFHRGAPIHLLLRLGCCLSLVRTNAERAANLGVDGESAACAVRHELARRSAVRVPARERTLSIVVTAKDKHDVLDQRDECNGPGQQKSCQRVVGHNP